MSKKAERHLARAKRFALASARPAQKPPLWVRQAKMESQWYLLEEARTEHQRHEARSSLIDWAFEVQAEEERQAKAARRKRR